MSLRVVGAVGLGESKSSASCSGGNANVAPTKAEAQAKGRQMAQKLHTEHKIQNKKGQIIGTEAAPLRAALAPAPVRSQPEEAGLACYSKSADAYHMLPVKDAAVIGHYYTSHRDGEPDYSVEHGLGVLLGGFGEKAQRFCAVFAGPPLDRPLSRS